MQEYIELTTRIDARIGYFSRVLVSYWLANMRSSSIKKVHENYYSNKRWEKNTFPNIQKMRWCIFGPTPIPSTAHPTYKHVVLTAVVGPMHCRSDGHIKNSILVHQTYFKLSHWTR